MTLTRTQCSVMGLALALGILYWSLLPFKPYPMGWLLKPIPMFLYAWLMWQAFPGWVGRLLAVGFVFAGFGDFFLDFGDRDGLFRQALLAFLVNQLAFAVAFFMLSQGKSWSWLRMAPAMAYGVLLAYWLLPQTGALFIPVTLYLICLLLMVLVAARVEARVGALWCGAMLFLLADSLIGVNKFAEPFPYAVIIIVSCYFTGQSLIAYGLLRIANGAVNKKQTA